MKTIDELRASLEAILHADGINLKMYLGTGPSDARTYRLANFDDGATEAVSQQYVHSIDQFLANEDLATKPLSDLDHRADTLFMYDLAEAPNEFSALTALSSGVDPAMFEFADHDLSSVTSLVIKISSVQNSVLFFKKFYPVSLVKRDQILLVVKDKTRFSIVNQDILKITSGFEVMFLDGEFYINDFGKFEKTFSFDQIAKKETQKVVAEILRLNLVDDSKGYLAAAVGSRKDILRAGKSPVLGIDSTIIATFAVSKQHQIGIKVVDGKLVLSSKAAVHRFYKLLNDDYLTSELTHMDYETLAKNLIEISTVTA